MPAFLKSAVLCAAIPLFICSCRTGRTDKKPCPPPVNVTSPALLSAADKIAQMVIQHPFPPAVQSSARAYMSPIVLPDDSIEVREQLATRLTKQLEVGGRLRFVDGVAEPLASPPPGARSPTEDLVAARTTAIGKLGARYIFDVRVALPDGNRPGHAKLTVEVTDTDTRLTVLRKVAPAHVTLSRD